MAYYRDLFFVFFLAATIPAGNAIADTDNNAPGPVVQIASAVTLGRFGTQERSPVMLLAAVQALRRILPDEVGAPDPAAEFLQAVRMLAQGNEAVLAMARLADATVKTPEAEPPRYKTVSVGTTAAAIIPMDVMRGARTDVAVIGPGQVELSLSIRDKAGGEVCSARIRSKPGLCTWRPLSTGKVAIEIANPGLKPTEVIIYMQ